MPTVFGRFEGLKNSNSLKLRKNKICIDPRCAYIPKTQARGKGYKKPRTYRQRSRKQLLSVAKDKRIGHKKVRKCIRQQLGYLRRNLNTIDQLGKHPGFAALNRCQYKELLVISEVFREL
ncbi:hypothetical protein [Desulfogranum marinum]|uniref:hypothetical protein n=1 Tax=Desulfogranum marinum TaxID=453220 RepID=UPI001964FC69|nr:hypothetical protein [Desulfogranum marinum]MBM9515147.1 hypothetical protein [Desulfogranum marinum]